MQYIHSLLHALPNTNRTPSNPIPQQSSMRYLRPNTPLTTPPLLILSITVPLFIRRGIRSLFSAPKTQQVTQMENMSTCKPDQGLCLVFRKWFFTANAMAWLRIRNWRLGCFNG